MIYTDKVNELINGYDVPEYVAEDIINIYLEYHTNISFKEYINKYIHVTTISRIKDTNKKYKKILSNLCTSGKAEFWQEEELVVFFNWDVCEHELIRNFGIVW